MVAQHETFRLETAGGIEYDRVEGPTLSIRRDEERVVETVRIRASNVLAFRLEAMPPPIFLFNDSAIAPYRRLPGAEWYVAESLEFRPQTQDLPADPFGVDGDAPSDTYNDFYLCTITYRPWLESQDEPRDTNDPQTFLEVEKTAGAQFLSIPPTNSEVQEIDSLGRLPDGATSDEDTAPKLVNKDLQHGMTMVIPTVEYTLTWPLVLNPPFELIERTMGKVNNAALPIFDNSPRETVLFMGYSARQRFVWDGATARAQPWEVQYKFSKRAINRRGKTMEENNDGRVFGWNHEFSPTIGDWVLISVGNGNKLHDSADFLQLFQAVGT